MRSNALPAIDQMSAGTMPFVLVDEPTRTRADAAEAAREALELIGRTRALSATARLEPDPSEKGARRITFPDGGAVRMKRYGGSDVEFQLLIERDHEFALSCTVAARWAHPSKPRLAAALDLFEAAAKAVVEPAAGDEAMLDLRAHIVRTLQTDGIDVVDATAATPWRNGVHAAAAAPWHNVVLKGSSDMIIAGGGDPWTGVEGAFVVCVRTFAGVTLAIEPLQLTATADMFDPMETLRLLARLER